MDRPVHFIGLASGWGASIMGTADGPVALWKSTSQDSGKTFPQHFKATDTFCDFHENLRPVDSYQGLCGDSLEKRRTEVIKACQKASNLVKSVFEKNEFPFVIGGDHSLAAGTWHGIKAGLKAQNRSTDFGLIWIDAHLDAHTALSSPSNAPHGMPVAGLLGAEKNIFSHLEGVVIKPNRVFYIAARSFEPEEIAFLEKKGVKIYFMEDVQKESFESIFQSIIKNFHTENISYGISFDIDAFDPIEAPGTGAPAAGGLLANEVLPAIKNICQDEKCLAFEILEYNPHLDYNDKTKNLMWALITTVLK